MTRTFLVSISVTGLVVGALAAGAGCQAIAGIEDRPVDPIRDGCSLPSGVGDAMIRFANLVPTTASVDVCVRPAGARYGRPVLRGGGTGCPGGFSYTQVSAPFSAPTGQVDVKVVAAGSTCDGATIAETLGVQTPAGSSTTVALMGGASTSAQLHAYPDTTTPSPAGNSQFRIIHAIPNGPALTFGFANADRLPTDIGGKLIADPLAFTESTRPDSKVSVGRMNAQGYIELPGTAVNLGAAPGGTQRAVLLTPLPPNQGGRTVWAVGDPNGTAYPVRALLCHDADPSVNVANVPLTQCDPSALPTLSVDAFNANLTGGRALDEDPRRPHIIDAVGARESDLMCITGVGRGADRDAIIQKAKDTGAFPYSVSANTNLDTEPTDARDQNGNVPPKPTVPPCGGTVAPATVDAAMDCVMQNCSTTHGPDGVLSGGTACLSEKCAPRFIAMLAGDTDGKRCYGCMVFSTASYETHAQTKTQCTTDVREYKLFKGETPSIILSKFPIKSSETFTLPSTLNQRAIHRAEVEIESGVTIDYYCAELTPAYGALIVDYSAYANGQSGGEDWHEEQKLQARRIIDWVKQKSGTRPAIISGDWATSRADAANGLSDENPALPDMVEAPGVFSLGVPASYVPHCTECKSPENPYNTDLSTWELKTYLSNMPKGVDSASLFWTDSPVPLAGGKTGPLSSRWGFNVRVIRP
jgi:hypothetical protein